MTASGGNEVHGSVYEFLRNNDLDARNFFDQGAAPQFQRNEFGAALGGPIQKNKTFLFGNYEGFRQNLGLSDVTLVPDNNARLGYLPDASGKLVHVGVAPGVEHLAFLVAGTKWPGVRWRHRRSVQPSGENIREDFGTVRLDHTFSDRDSRSSGVTR